MATSDDITTMLEAVRDGDRDAIDALFPVLYGELRRLAQAQRNEWRGEHTLNTTALVHEAYLKLVRQDRVGLNERSHFFALAAKAMRHILTDYARRRQAQKRGGGVRPVELKEAEAANPVSAESATELLALEDALARLEAANERQARVVECRFFAGLRVPETAMALGISEATVKRDWRVARAILRDALDPPSPRH